MRRLNISVISILFFCIVSSAQLIPFAFFQNGLLVTPDAVNWEDFYNDSSTLSITGITASINLEMSAVHDSGTPTYEYSKNGGGWTAFSPGSASSSSFSNNDTLQFRVTGTTDDYGTITVTNTSDGSTVVDTVVGTILEEFNLCSDTTSASSSGHVYDSGGLTANYSNSENCTFSMTSTSGIQIEFVGSFSVESNYDYLFIESAGLGLDTYTGTSLPTIKKYAGPIDLHFTSDNSERRAGFNLVWTTVTVDPTPVVLNWVDFIETSTSESFTGIDVPIVVEISAVNGTGTPTLEYRKNMIGGWTSFTPASPGKVAIEASESLAFRATGAAADTATLTVKNLSDGSAVLDTVLATVATDETPNSINWADFAELSSTRTVQGINAPISLEFSAVYNIGTPIIEYSKNGGAWTAFTPGSAATVATVNNDTYQFRTSGVSPHSATITVTNITDSSTVLDTVTGVDGCTDASGETVNGQCWVLGSTNQDCEDVCTGTTLTAVHADTTNYAGSGGSDANCAAVLDAFSVGSGTPATATNTRGCQYRPSNGNRFRGTNATSYTSNSSNFRRACACTYDTVPDAIDWVNFYAASEIKSFSGLSTAISVELSAVNGTGAPSLRYKINTGAWTSFTPASPATISINDGDTLRFDATGTVDDTATVTITNLTESTVIDTTVATVITASPIILSTPGVTNFRVPTYYASLDVQVWGGGGGGGAGGRGGHGGNGGGGGAAGVDTGTGSSTDGVNGSDSRFNGNLDLRGLNGYMGYSGDNGYSGYNGGASSGGYRGVGGYRGGDGYRGSTSGPIACSKTIGISGENGVSGSNGISGANSGDGGAGGAGGAGGSGGGAIGYGAGPGSYGDGGAGGAGGVGGDGGDGGTGGGGGGGGGSGGGGSGGGAGYIACSWTDGSSTRPNEGSLYTATVGAGGAGGTAAGNGQDGSPGNDGRIEIIYSY